MMANIHRLFAGIYFKEESYMKKKMTTIAFSDTPVQADKLNALIASYKNTEGNLMPVLQGAQDIYGYLPFEVMKTIALGLDVSVSEVYGVASFYSQFTLNPKGKVSIAVCLGTACYVKGSGKLHEKCMEIPVSARATEPV